MVFLGDVEGDRLFVALVGAICAQDRLLRRLVPQIHVYLNEVFLGGAGHQRHRFLAARSAHTPFLGRAVEALGMVPRLTRRMLLLVRVDSHFSG